MVSAANSEQCERRARSPREYGSECGEYGHDGKCGGHGKYGQYRKEGEHGKYSMCRR